MRKHSSSSVHDYKNLNGSLSPGFIVIGSPFQSKMTSAAAPSSTRVSPPAARSAACVSAYVRCSD